MARDALSTLRLLERAANYESLGLELGLLALGAAVGAGVIGLVGAAAPAFAAGGLAVALGGAAVGSMRLSARCRSRAERARGGWL
jgi:hypothetical protein